MNTLIYTALLGLFSMVAEIFNLRKLVLPVAVIALAIIFGLNLYDWNLTTYHYHNMFKVDNFSVAFSALSIGITLIILILSGDYFGTEEKNISDYIAILVFVLCGSIMMFGFNNLAILFIGIETLSIGLYAMAGSKRFDVKSNEAGFKYFLMGAFMSCILLFGMALIFGSTGSFYIDKIALYTISYVGAWDLKFIIGLSLIVFAMLFKVSAAPFHFWAPDVYEGAPPIITAFMSTLVKVAAFGAFYKLFSSAFGFAYPKFSLLLNISAVITLMVGNLTALVQQNFKRLLAYSGIAHAGYILLLILCLPLKPAGAILYYGVAYSLSTLAAFAVALLVFKQADSENIYAFNGLAQKNPLLAAGLTMAMLGLAGIPPFAGFAAKYYMLTLTLENGFYFTGLLAVITSIIGVYYYFKVIIAMYGKPATETVIVSNVSNNLILWLCVALSLLFGVWPSLITDLLLGV